MSKGVHAVINRLNKCINVMCQCQSGVNCCTKDFGGILGRDNVVMRLHGYSVS